LVFNRRSNKGKQVVLHGSDWPVRYRVFQEEKAEASSKGGN